jgi:hypothetical protein
MSKTRHLTGKQLLQTTKTDVPVANAMLIVIMRSDFLEKLRLQTVNYSILDPNYFAIVCARGLI